MLALRGVDAFASSSHNTALPVFAATTRPGDAPTFMSYFWVAWAVGVLFAHRVVTRWGGLGTAHRLERGRHRKVSRSRERWSVPPRTLGPKLNVLLTARREWVHRLGAPGAGGERRSDPLSRTRAPHGEEPCLEVNTSP